VDIKNKKILAFLEVIDDDDEDDEKVQTMKGRLCQK